MIDLRTRDRAALANMLYIRCGNVTQLEAFDLVDTFFNRLDKTGYSLLRDELVTALTAAAVRVIDPAPVSPVVDRSVVVPFLEECGWKRGEMWSPATSR